jgi:hypothetical protein
MFYFRLPSAFSVMSALIRGVIPPPALSGRPPASAGAGEPAGGGISGGAMSRDGRSLRLRSRKALRLKSACAQDHARSKSDIGSGPPRTLVRPRGGSDTACLAASAKSAARRRRKGSQVPRSSSLWIAIAPTFFFRIVFLLEVVILNERCLRSEGSERAARSAAPSAARKLRVWPAPL